jgi:hypothetical protein
LTLIAPAAPGSRLVTLPEDLPELTLGYEAGAWAMRHLLHPNGPRAGRPWRFTEGQLDFLLHWYAVDEDGRWLYQHGVRRLAKGSGKSPFAAVVALIELCAPVRLDGFDPSKRGGCAGRPVDMPLVQIAATAESQTANTMRMVRALAPKGSRVVDEHALDPGLTRYYKAPVGTLEVITSSASAAEGAESTFVVADETEHWTPTNGGPELSNTLLDNLTKSGSRMLETCNAWTPGLQSVAEESYAAWVAQEEGRVRGTGRMLYDARIAPWDTDLADEASLRAGLEFVYADCWWQDIDPIIGRIWSPKARPDDSRRKYLNQPTAAVDAWVTPQAWAQCARPDRAVEPGESIVMFFDGSRSRDATALIGCCMSDGHVFSLGTWEPDPSHDTVDVVDVAAVDATVAKAFELYDVVGFFADVKEWEGFTKVSWPAAYADRLLVEAVPGGKDPQSIAWDMRSRVYEFGVACELTEAEIADQALTHDGSAVLSRHVGNARRHPTRGVVTLRKDSPDSPRKIDAAVAMVGARMTRRTVLASKEWQRRMHRSVGAGRVIALD